MSDLNDLPELQALTSSRQTIRIPDEIDVPLTNRVKGLIDTPQFRRLSKVSQLGLVALVYPAANHTRFEHSLGVYRQTLLFLRELSHYPAFCKIMPRSLAEQLLVAALFHDLGHWPYCHPIEDMKLPGVPKHEDFAAEFLNSPAISQRLQKDWQMQPDDVMRILQKRGKTKGQRIAESILSGPIDVDKMDYLYRDSLHAGVPYGRNFDRHRLIGSLCLNESGDGLAITEKGKTAAEMMVFARYVMFSEVYWHHAVRSATAMLQRGFYSCYENANVLDWCRQTDDSWIQAFGAESARASSYALWEGLFGPTRQLYKRLAQYSYFENGEFYLKLARKPYPYLVRVAEEFAAILSRDLKTEVKPIEVLVDAPPVGLEVEFNLDIFFPKANLFRKLGEVSPVVSSLATKQFDDFVKRVRIFVHPRLLKKMNLNSSTEDWLLEAISRVPEVANQK